MRKDLKNDQYVGSPTDTESTRGAGPAMYHRHACVSGPLLGDTGHRGRPLQTVSVSSFGVLSSGPATQKKAIFFWVSARQSVRRNSNHSYRAEYSNAYTRCCLWKFAKRFEIFPEKVSDGRRRTRSSLRPASIDENKERLLPGVECRRPKASAAPYTGRVRSSVLRSRFFSRTTNRRLRYGRTDLD